MKHDKGRARLQSCRKPQKQAAASAAAVRSFIHSGIFQGLSGLNAQGSIAGRISRGERQTKKSKVNGNQLPDAARLRGLSHARRINL